MVVLIPITCAVFIFAPWLQLAFQAESVLFLTFDWRASLGLSLGIAAAPLTCIHACSSGGTLENQTKIPLRFLALYISLSLVIYLFVSGQTYLDVASKIGAGNGYLTCPPNVAGELLMVQDSKSCATEDRLILNYLM